MNLRPYQQRAIAEARAHVAAGRMAPLIVGPTGSGKTTIGAEIARCHVQQGGHVVWAAHRSELVEQGYDTLRAAGLRCTVVGDTIARPRMAGASVTVCMVQTLLARGERPHGTLGILDEAHHYAADEWSAIISAYPFRVGLTATPERVDGRGLSGAFDCIVQAATIRELTDMGYLVPCEIIAPREKLDPNTIAQEPVRAYQEHAVGRRTIVFASNVRAAENFREGFRAAGIRAECVTGSMATGDRKRILADYAAGLIPVLVNVNVLTEGFDDPATSCCILARGCNSPGMYIQIVGRILRPATGKTDALFIDLRGVSHDHGRPDDDRVYSLDGKGIRRKNDDGLRFCGVCGASMSLDDTACPSCGYAGTGAGIVLPDVVNAPLVRYARKRIENDVQRAYTLARWIDSGVARGFKPGWAMAKYRAVYGDWPTFDVKKAAADMRRQKGAA